MPFTAYTNSPKVEMEFPRDLTTLTTTTTTSTTKECTESPDTMMCDNGDADSSQFSMSPREQQDHESEMCLRVFESWTQTQQTEYVEQLIMRMSFHQHEHLYSILMPMLQRDFITVLPGEWEGREGRQGSVWEGGRGGKWKGYGRREGREVSRVVVVVKEVWEGGEGRERKWAEWWWLLRKCGREGRVHVHR